MLSFTHLSPLERSRRRAALLFLIPLVAALLLVAAWPLARTMAYSFTDATLDRVDEVSFVGLDNYVGNPQTGIQGVLPDPLWWQSVENTLFIAVISVALETVFGLIVALVLHRGFPGRAFVRAAVLVPWAIPTIVSAKMWGWILHDQFGLFNDALLKLGVIDQPLAWTADPSLAMGAVIAVDVWKTTPFMALLILAALQMLPTSCYESARLDGVHPLRVFWRITLPLIRPALLVAVIFRFLDALRIFDLVYVLTSNSEDTMTMSVYSRQQLIEFQDVGMGSAAATLLFFVVALLTATYLVAARVRVDGETG